MKSPRLVFLLAILAIASYAPFLEFPFVANSYIEIPTSRLLATPATIHLLLANANWHFRTVYAVANSLIVQFFGFSPRPFYIASVLLHACCVLLIYGLSRWRFFPPGAALWAAGFFAVFQGHHEPIVLLSSWPDLFAGLCACASLFCWIRWLQADSKLSYSLALLWYFAATVSSDAAFVSFLLLLLPVIINPATAKAKWLSILPFAALGLGALTVQLLFRPRHVAWNDSVPSLDPWFITFAWTFAAIAVIGVLQHREMIRFIVGCLGWVFTAFLANLYVERVLGMRTSAVYLASIAVALLVGVAFSLLLKRMQPILAAVLALALVSGNVALLWTISRRQLLAYATPTTTLVNAAAFAASPIEISCFPYSIEVADAAAASFGGQIAPVTDENAIRKPNCISFRYRDSMGNVRQIFQRPVF